MTNGSKSRLASLSGALVIYTFVASLALAVIQFGLQGYDWFMPDFSVFYTVSVMMADGRVAEVYDWQAVTQAHPMALPPNTVVRPWVYPPTMLPFVGPLHGMPFWVAFGVWIAISAMLYGSAAWAWTRRLDRSTLWAVGLCLISFPVLSVMNAGQTALIVGAFVLIGLMAIERHEVLAALAFVLAGFMKPSMMVLLPLALAAGGHWRVFILAAIFSSAGVIGVTLAYGVDIWLAWLGPLGRFFFDAVVPMNILSRVATPTGLAVQLGATEATVWPWQVLGSIIGIVACVSIFRRTKDLSYRLVGLIGGALMVTPYAVHYDLTIMLPAAAMFLLHRAGRPTDLILAVLALLVFFPIPPATAAVTCVFTVGVAAIAWIRPDREITLPKSGTEPRHDVKLPL